MGASINFSETDGHAILDPAWIYGDNGIDKSMLQIPCILGACYAFSKRYWQYLKGLSGLINYGCDETYLSLKVWMEGGACMLMKEIKVGHIFREKAPYAIVPLDFMYNKLMMAETILPVKYKNIVFREMHKNNPDGYEEAMSLLISNKKLLAELKAYYRQIFTRDIDSFISFNQCMKDK
jgi:hypothetical protein